MIFASTFCSHFYMTGGEDVVIGFESIESVRRLYAERVVAAGLLKSQDLQVNSGIRFRLETNRKVRPRIGGAPSETGHLEIGVIDPQTGNQLLRAV